jgi:hypothetical protein
MAAPSPEAISMEDLAQDGNKGSLKTEAYELLYSLQSKASSPDETKFYLPLTNYPHKRLWELDLEKVKFLEGEGILKMQDYFRPFTGAVDPNIKELNLLPKGQEHLKTRTTITRTETKTETTIQQTIQEEEPAWKVNKRYRNFVRTERGYGIVTSSPAGLASTIQGHINVLRLGNISRAEWKHRQIDLMYALLYRYDDISEPLRHEAEDYRDLPFTRKSKQN